MKTLFANKENNNVKFEVLTVAELNNVKGGLRDNEGHIDSDAHSWMEDDFTK